MNLILSLLLYFRPKHAANHEDPQVAMINGRVYGIKYQEKKRARGLDSVWRGSENLYRKVNILLQTQSPTAMSGPSPWSLI